MLVSGIAQSGQNLALSRLAIMSILKSTLDISFICNDLDLTDVLPKTENALSTAIYQSEVRQLEKTSNLQYAICINMFVRKNSPNLPKRTQKPAFPASNNLVSPNTPHQTPQHQFRASTRHFGTYVLIAYSQKFYLIC